MRSTERKFLIAGPNIGLSCLMLSFTLTLAVYYLIENEQAEGWRMMFVLVSMIVFTLVHGYYWLMRLRTYLYPVLVLDFLTAASYGFVFIRSDFPDHLFVGITALSVFLYLNHSRALIIVWTALLLLYFLPLFALEWLMIEDVNRIQYFDHALFILFAGIVGFLLSSYQKNRSHMLKLNSELSAYALKAEELGSMRERVRIARDIHDAVGHKMTALLVQLQVGRKLYRQDPERCLNIMQESEDIARSALQEVRLSVRAIREEFNLGQSPLEAIRTLAEEFARLTNIRASLRFSGAERPVPTSIQLTAYRIVQEALTNAHKHSQARNIAIDLAYLEDMIRLHIRNDGCLAKEYKPGFGLLSIQERVAEWNGTARFEASPENGFIVDITLPLPAAIHREKEFEVS